MGRGGGRRKLGMLLCKVVREFVLRSANGKQKNNHLPHNLCQFTLNCKNRPGFFCPQRTSSFRQGSIFCPFYYGSDRRTSNLPLTRKDERLLFSSWRAVPAYRKSVKNAGRWCSCCIHAFGFCHATDVSLTSFYFRWARARSDFDTCEVFSYKIIVRIPLTVIRIHDSDVKRRVLEACPRTHTPLPRE